MPKMLMAASALAQIQGNHMQRLRDAGFEIVIPSKPGQLTEDDLLRELPGCFATLAGTETYSPNLIQRCPDLRVIARAGVGYDSVDLPAATKAGVAVTITPGANHDAVAEHTMALLLGLAKGLLTQDKGTRAGKWPRTARLPLRGSTLGLVGLGRIGKSVVERAAPFNMRMIAYEPYPDQAFVSRYKIELMSLEKVFGESDWLSLHLPMSAETKHLISRKTLALMKPSAHIINTARGGLICEADLVEALKAKRIAGAGLDVFETEPFVSSPLFEFDNVLMTAHTAGVDWLSLKEMAELAAESIVALSQGKWPAEQVVNAEVKGRFVRSS